MSGIAVEGEVEGSGNIAVATTEADEAVRRAHVLMMVVPATGHRCSAQAVATHLVDGQVVVLNPGRTFGALAFRQVLTGRGTKADVIVSEAQTLIYASRATNPGQVRIFRIKNSIPRASISAYRITDVLKFVRLAYPQFVAGDNVFKTSFDNIGAVFHPALTVLNAGWIEDDAEFQFYIQGCTPSVARVLERLDAERVAVAKAVGIRVMTARQRAPGRDEPAHDQERVGGDSPDLVQPARRSLPTAPARRHHRERERYALNAQRGVPVEVNESHPWSMRGAPDTVAVVMAFLAACNAKRAGVRHYVAQYMFDTPTGTTPRMDLAKVLAQQHRVDEIAGAEFVVFREVRAGLGSLSPRANLANGQWPRPVSSPWPCGRTSFTWSASVRAITPLRPRSSLNPAKSPRARSDASWKGSPILPRTPSCSRGKTNSSSRRVVCWS